MNNKQEQGEMMEQLELKQTAEVTNYKAAFGMIIGIVVILMGFSYQGLAAELSLVGLALSYFGLAAYKALPSRGSRGQAIAGLWLNGIYLASYLIVVISYPGIYG